MLSFWDVLCLNYLWNNQMGMLRTVLKYLSKESLGDWGKKLIVILAMRIDEMASRWGTDAMRKASETECWGTQAFIHWMEKEKLPIESDEEEPEGMGEIRRGGCLRHVFRSRPSHNNSHFSDLLEKCSWRSEGIRKKPSMYAISSQVSAIAWLLR